MQKHVPWLLSEVKKTVHPQGLSINWSKFLQDCVLEYYRKINLFYFRHFIDLVAKVTVKVKLLKILNSYG